MKAFIYLACAVMVLVAAIVAKAKNHPFGSETDPLAPPKAAPATPPPAKPLNSDAAMEAKAAELVRDFGESLAFVEGGSGQGSGFVVEGGGVRCLLTNQHVVAGNPNFRFTLLNLAPLQTGAAVAAVGHDVMRFEVKSAVKGLPVMSGVEKEVAIGDPVAVLGNAEGARVIRPWVGKVVGLGPNLVEVNAEFVPGNSGSPIVHLPTGKVIGIATYLITRSADELTGNATGEKRIRRFGYRLDSIRQWQPVNWAAYNTEYATVKGVEDLTTNFAQLLKAIVAGNLRSATHLHPVIDRSLENFFQAVGRQGVSAADRQRAVHELLASLRAASQSDIQQASARLRYDFFVRELADEKEVRAKVYKVFDEAVKTVR